MWTQLRGDGHQPGQRVSSSAQEGEEVQEEEEPGLPGGGATRDTCKRSAKLLRITVIKRELLVQSGNKLTVEKWNIRGSKSDRISIAIQFIISNKHFDLA